MHTRVGLEQRLLTVDEFHAMARAGILTEDDRVELIDGKIITMTPIGGPHMGCVNRLTRLLVSRTLPEITVSVQNPVRLGLHQELQPDLALLRPRTDPGRVPTAEDVILLIEVSDATLAKDREVKLPRYAAAGIPEVWIVALPERVIEVYRGQGQDGYAECRRAEAGDEVGV
ncbi:MAG TPA: Uma2 family endonuclease, partial [Longimicrobiaceae bacterium]|nr:Uma2 family endonuclease [Longimicrobiaceae bacterium]